MLSHEEKTVILAEFPNIKLSYENITHKKVYNSDIILAIPEGKKCFAWFTTFQGKNVCFIMELAENKQISNIKIMNAMFTSDMSYSSIFYGTIFNHSNNQFFTLEDVFFYKGNDVSRKNWHEKFVLFKKIMEHDIKQASYNKSFIVFGLPILSNNLDDLITKIKTVKYKISSIQFKLFNKSNTFIFMSFVSLNDNHNHNNNNNNNHNHNNNIRNNTEIIPPTKTTYNIVQKVDNQSKPMKSSYQNYKGKMEAIFNVKADIQNDIYHLYYNDINSPNYIYYEIALIPTFTTSVMMNKLFRNIKENINLDALEESDDEEEFQNENDDRFVNLEKRYNMLCSFNNKFKKWVPLRLSPDNAKIITQNELSILEKNRY